MNLASQIRSALLFGCLAHAAYGQHVPRPLNRPAPRVRPQQQQGGANAGTGSLEAPRRDSEQQIDRLEKMSAAERRTALEALPADRRDRIEKRLSHLQKLSPEQRAQLEKRLERFQNLPSNRQAEIRRIAQDIKQLPRERKVAVRQELDTLRTLAEGERQSRLQSSTWKRQFTPQEQEILKQSSELLPQRP